MLGQGQEILGSVAENARTIAAENAAPEQQGQKVAANAMEPAQTKANNQAAVEGQQAGNAVTITPQLAEGLVKMTGDDSWRRAMGTKMDPRIYSALLTAGVRKKASEDALAGKTTIEGMKEGAGQKKTETEVGGKKDVATIQADAKKAVAKTPKPKAASTGKEETPEQKKEKATKLLDSITKAKDPQAKAAMVANYNGLAKDLGLQPYEEGAADKLKDAIGGLFSKAADAITGEADKKREAAVKYLKDNNLPVTDGNIKHYLDNQ